MLKCGLKGKQERLVTTELTAASYGSGALEVFATPAMIALLEETAWKSVAPHLDPGCSTVGTKVNVSHLAATPLGMHVWCESELVEIDRRRLVFQIAVYDEAGLIGEGTHERFVVENERFLKKVQEQKGV